MLNFDFGIKWGKILYGEKDFEGAAVSGDRPVSIPLVAGDIKATLHKQGSVTFDFGGKSVSISPDGMPGNSGELISTSHLAVLRIAGEMEIGLSSNKGYTKYFINLGKGYRLPSGRLSFKLKLEGPIYANNHEQGVISFFDDSKMPLLDFSEFTIFYGKSPAPLQFSWNSDTKELHLELPVSAVYPLSIAFAVGAQISKSGSANTGIGLGFGFGFGFGKKKSHTKSATRSESSSSEDEKQKAARMVGCSDLM